MKITITEPREVEVVRLQVNAEPRYLEDSKVNGEEDTTEGDNMPCMDGSRWRPLIDIETGVILNWRQGTTAEVHYKVADCCGWELLDKEGKRVLAADDGYVPDTLCSKEEGYGDYIIMDIDENGRIADWKFNPEDFTGVED